MASGELYIDPAEVDNIGRQFQEFSNRYSDLMKKIRSNVDTLRTHWSSNAASEFEKVFQERAQVIEQMDKAFADFGTVLGTTASAANTADSNITSAVGR